MTFVNQEQADFWQGMAAIWVEIEDRLEMVAGQPGRLAMDRLDLRSGQRVLDLGCGTGLTTTELANRVSPGGTVTGVDISDEMLAAARRRANELGITDAEFIHADVQAHDLSPGAYDAAYSRFGVMFFSDPVAAFANVRRALRPQARLSFVCWQNPFANEWMLVPGMAAMTATGSPPPMPEPGQPGPFAFADSDRVRTILTDAGFEGIDISPHDDVLVWPATDIEAQAAASLKVGAAREALKDADEGTRQKAYELVVEALRGKVEDGEVRLTRGVWLVAATS